MRLGQYHSYRKRKFGHRCIQKEDNMKTQGEDKSSTSQGEKTPEETNTANTSLQQNWEKINFLFKPPSLWYFVLAAFSN